MKATTAAKSNAIQVLVAKCERGVQAAAQNNGRIREAIEKGLESRAAIRERLASAQDRLAEAEAEAALGGVQPDAALLKDITGIRAEEESVEQRLRGLQRRVADVGVTFDFSEVEEEFGRLVEVEFAEIFSDFQHKYRDAADKLIEAMKVGVAIAEAMPVRKLVFDSGPDRAMRSQRDGLLDQIQKTTVASMRYGQPHVELGSVAYGDGEGGPLEKIWPKCPAASGVHAQLAELKALGEQLAAARARLARSAKEAGAQMETVQAAIERPAAPTMRSVSLVPGGRAMVLRQE